jgi:RNA polymerase sigma-70 factor (ECF subfamily)
VEREDSALTAAITAGDRTAEEELYLRFVPRVRCMVESALHHGPDCEDVTCVILEDVIAGLRRGSFRGESRIGTYIYAVARNKIMEHFRRRRPETIDLPGDIPDRAPAPDQGIIREELDAAIHSALAGLSPKYRTVLYLYFYKGMTIGQIAQSLDVAPRRVSEWKDYGLGVLRSRFGRGLERYR